MLCAVVVASSRWRLPRVDSGMIIAANFWAYELRTLGLYVHSMGHSICGDMCAIRIGVNRWSIWKPEIIEGEFKFHNSPGVYVFMKRRTDTVKKMFHREDPTQRALTLGANWQVSERWCQSSYGQWARSQSNVIFFSAAHTLGKRGAVFPPVTLLCAHVRRRQEITSRL